MIEIIYIEDGIRDHPKTLEIIQRFPNASIIGCGHYKEVFNPAGQNFRLQKKKPYIIIARQEDELLHPSATYGAGLKKLYFSHLLNCLYDCRYCFLQGNTHPLICAFVNSKALKKQSRHIKDQANDWFSRIWR